MNTYQLSDIVYLDVETSGLDRNRHALLEIGACHVSGHEFSMECRPHPGAEVEQEALDVNGTDWEAAWSREMSVEEAVVSFDRWVQTYVRVPDSKLIICARNPAFDVGFLRAAFDRAGIRPTWFSYRHLDITTLLYQSAILSGLMATPELLNGDSGFYEMLDLPEEEKPHRALNGAKGAMDVHISLTRRMEKLSELRAGACRVGV